MVLLRLSLGIGFGFGTDLLRLRLGISGRDGSEITGFSLGATVFWGKRFDIPAGYNNVTVPIVITFKLIVCKT